MKDISRIKKHGVLALWEAAGFLFILAGGVFMHSQFVDRPAFWLALVSPLNESLFEHLKILVFPALLFSLIELYFIHHLAANFWIARAVSLYVMSILTIIVHASVKWITGTEFFMIDIILFTLVILFGQYINYRFYTSAKLSRQWQATGLFGVVFLVLCMSVFSFFPPQIGFLFQDPVSGQYGYDFSSLSTGLTIGE